MSSGTNRFTAKCAKCGRIVQAQAGRYVKPNKNARALVYHDFCMPDGQVVDAPEEWQSDDNGGEWPVENASQVDDSKTDKAIDIARLLLELTSTPKLDETRVRAIVAEMASNDVTYRDRIIIETKDDWQIELPDETRHEVFADVLAAVMCGLNVYLVGPAGCGKTELASQVARAIGARFGHTGAVGSKYDLSGYRDANGNYVSNCELPDFYENGGLFLFDEIDGSVPNAVLFTNTALANGACAFPHKTIERHPNFRAIAAANTYGNGADLNYVGRNPLDAASKDRFVMIPMDYDETLERQLYGDTEWTGYVQRARKAIQSLGIRHVVSMRATMQGKKLLETGMARDKVEQYCLWKGLETDQVNKIKNKM